VVHLATTMPVDIVFAGPGLEELFFSRIRRHRRRGKSIPVASPEDLIVMKLLAARPRDIEDVLSVLRALGKGLDVPLVTATLKLLEEALAQSDLQPLFARLRSEAARGTRVPGAKGPRAPAMKRPITKRRTSRVARKPQK
jgi:hypothetical protein